MHFSGFLSLAACLLSVDAASSKPSTTFQILDASQSDFGSNAGIGTNNLRNGQHDSYSAGKVVAAVTKFNISMQQAIDTMSDNKPPTPSCEEAVKAYQGIGKFISTEADGMVEVACNQVLTGTQRSEVASGAEKAQVLFAQVGALLTKNCPDQEAAITAGTSSFDEVFEPIAPAFSASCDA